MSTGCGKLFNPEFSMNVSDITSTSATINYMIGDYNRVVSIEENLYLVGDSEKGRVVSCRVAQFNFIEGSEFDMTKYTYDNLTPGTTYHLKTTMRFILSAVTRETEFTTLSDPNESDVD